MRGYSIRPGALKIARLLQILAVATIVCVAALASAPLRPYLSEWRGVQKDYNQLAIANGRPAVAVEIKQIWKPQLEVADRCTTCHLGMAGTADPIPGVPLFAAHPPIPHDPREFGCTVCHGGQGRATTKEAAHGFVSHWDQQMLDARHLGAGCATCHDQFPTAPRSVLVAGSRLVDQLDCLACHKLDGRGRGDAPDLSGVGLKGFSRDWYDAHLAKHQAAATPQWDTSFGPVQSTDRAVIEQFLSTRVGAPDVVEARALALERGCLGCHKLGGIGGDEGPALDAVGRKAIGDLNLTHVPGTKTFANYMREHLIDPARVFPGSTMLPQDYSDRDVDLLTTWVLSMRTREMPAAFIPKDRVRRQILAEPQPERTPSENFGAFCSACHGPNGQGRSAGSSEARFPAIGSADFLNVASDDFITRTLSTGRPNRRMPALGAPGAALDEAAVRDLVGHLRSRLTPVPSMAALAALSPDPALGARVYRDDCAACHGRSGEGTALGSPLAPADPSLTTDRVYDATVHGVAGTAMSAFGDRPAESIAAVLRYVSALPKTASSRSSWSLGSGNGDRGADVYLRHCIGCHGRNGEGRVGPALANPAFLQAATAPYLAATIVRGRSGTPMPGFGRDTLGFSPLSADEVLDLTAFIRERLGREPRVTGGN